MVTVILQMSLVSTMHFGFRADEASSDNLNRISACLFAFGTVAAFTASRTLEKIQDDYLEGKFPLVKSTSFFGLDLPDMTRDRLGCFTKVSSLLLMLLGMTLILVVAYINVDAGPNRRQTVWSMASAGGAMIFGACLVLGQAMGESDRFLLIWSMFFSLFSMATFNAFTGWNAMSRNWFAGGGCDDFNATLPPMFASLRVEDCNREAHLTNALVALCYISWAACVGHAWLCWRLSERIQTEREGKNVFFNKAIKICGLSLKNTLDSFSRNVGLAVHAMLICTGVIFATWVVADSMQCDWAPGGRPGMQTPMQCTMDETKAYDLNSWRLKYNYIHVVLNVFCALFAWYGVYDNDRGILMLAFVMNICNMAFNFHEFIGELAVWRIPGWFAMGAAMPKSVTRACSQLSSISNGVVVVANWFAAVSCFLYSEALQDKRTHDTDPAKAPDEKIELANPPTANSANLDYQL